MDGIRSTVRVKNNFVCRGNIVADSLIANVLNVTNIKPGSLDLLTVDHVQPPGALEVGDAVSFNPGANQFEAGYRRTYVTDNESGDACEVFILNDTDAIYVYHNSDTNVLQARIFRDAGEYPLQTFDPVNLGSETFATQGDSIITPIDDDRVLLSRINMDADLETRVLTINSDNTLTAGATDVLAGSFGAIDGVQVIADGVVTGALVHLDGTTATIAYIGVSGTTATIGGSDTGIVSSNSNRGTFYIPSLDRYFSSTQNGGILIQLTGTTPAILDQLDGSLNINSAIVAPGSDNVFICPESSTDYHIVTATASALSLEEKLYPLDIKGIFGKDCMFLNNGQLVARNNLPGFLFPGLYFYVMDYDQSEQTLSLNSLIFDQGPTDSTSTVVRFNPGNNKIWCFFDEFSPNQTFYYTGTIDFESKTVQYWYGQNVFGIVSKIQARQVSVTRRGIVPVGTLLPGFTYRADFDGTLTTSTSGTVPDAPGTTEFLTQVGVADGNGDLYVELGEFVTDYPF